MFEYRKISRDVTLQDDHVQCATCKHIYGIKSGICPPGTMTYNVINVKLPGYEDCNAIQIQYNIKQGTQVLEQPTFPIQ